MQTVKTVVFDVGRVLIDFSYAKFFSLLNDRGGNICGEQDFSEKVDLSAYEHGVLSNEDFLRRVNSTLKNPLPVHQLKAAWNDLFTPIDEMLDFSRRLKAECGVYLFSNTSDLHWTHLQKTFNLSSLCHGLVASFQLGWMKPEKESFAAVEQHFDLQVENTLFVDDKAENVEGALSCGWQAFQHQRPADTIRQICQLTGYDG